MDKKTLRKEKLKCREELSAALQQTYSEEITKKLLEQGEVRGAGSILCYVSCRSEVDTLPFIHACLMNGKRIFCPRVLDGTEMEFYEIGELSELKRGTYDILEPEAEECRQYRYSAGDCMILPGAAFDRCGNRIGYGKGYYDRYLQRYPELRTVGVCFSCQMAERIPAETTDVKVNKILTENEVYNIV